MNNEAIKLIVSLLFSLFVAFSSLEYFYILPILLVLFYEQKNLIKIFKKLFLLNFFRAFSLNFELTGPVFIVLI